MLRGIGLWLLGIPIPIIILVAWLVGGHETAGVVTAAAG